MAALKHQLEDLVTDVIYPAVLEYVYNSEKCTDACPYYAEWHEAHPYGMTTATEVLAECTAEKPSDCPERDKVNAEALIVYCHEVGYL